MVTKMLFESIFEGGLRARIPFGVGVDLSSPPTAEVPPAAARIVIPTRRLERTASKSVDITRRDPNRGLSLCEAACGIWQGRAAVAQLLSGVGLEDPSAWNEEVSEKASQLVASRTRSVMQARSAAILEVLSENRTLESLSIKAGL